MSRVTETDVGRILTRSSGFLLGVSSHSLQPYRGCSFGGALCGASCYVQHNRWLTRGQPWGSFLEARRNAADAYRRQAPAERRWAHRRGGPFSIFMSSSTDPFVPQEDRFGITRAVLAAMVDEPPDTLILQTHTHRVLRCLDLYPRLRDVAGLRVHLSIETDRESLPGLPPHASPVEKRLAAAAELREHGIPVVVTVAPLLPIAQPRRFFDRLSSVADAIVIDHFIGGDGTPDGRRTRATSVPATMEALEPGSSDLAYRDRMVTIARQLLPGRVGVGPDGFAGRWLP